MTTSLCSFCTIPRYLPPTAPRVLIPRCRFQRPKAQTESTPAETMEKKDDVVGAVVIPTVVNKPWFRVTAVLGTVLLASTASGKQLLSTQAQNFVQLLSFAGWFGSSLWVILLSPRILFTTLPRQTFGKLQSKLFPQYFGFSVFCTLLLLLTKPAAGISYSLTAGLVSSLINWLYLTPAISKITAERYDLENAEVRDEEKIKAMVKKSSKYHALSSSLGLLALCVAVAHGWSLSTMMTV